MAEDSQAGIKKYAAVDLGAESGRVIVGDISEIEVVHRFPNRPVLLGRSIFWDILGIFTNIKTGLKEAFKKYPDQIASIAIDSWGVDYALLDGQGDLLGNPYHYRDSRTDGAMASFFARVPKWDVFQETGIQFMQLNTLYQLYAQVRDKAEILKQADCFLTLPCLLNYWMTGVKRNEYSHATTTQLYNPHLLDWSSRLIEALGLKREIFCEVVNPGTRLGKLLPAVAEEIGASPEVQVVTAASHDTASAVAAVPVVGADHYAYLSSGTWSLLGIESELPIITEKSFNYNFTNEGGAAGGFRFLKNITGLWIVQECKRCWDAQDRVYSYAELTEMAEAAGPAAFSLDPNDDRFLWAGTADDSMPDRVRAYCRETGQPVPETPAELTRGVLESLAGMYAKTIEQIEDVTGRSIGELYIIGGGSRNTLLCRLTANAAGIPVSAGPAEATAIGNIMIQAIAAGELESIAQGREVIRKVQQVKEYEPET